MSATARWAARLTNGSAGPVRIRVHPALCEGWGECHRWGGHLFPLDGDGHIDLHVVEVPAELADLARLGAGACPAGAITLIEETPVAAPATTSEGGL